MTTVSQASNIPILEVSVIIPTYNRISMLAEASCNLKGYIVPSATIHHPNLRRLGSGVIVLHGVRIGKGAVVGAGAVVTHYVPDGTSAVGVPARVINIRSNKADEREVDLACWSEMQ